MGVLVVLPMLLATIGCQQSSGADTLRELEAEVVEAIVSGDAEKLGDFLVDADAFVEACPERFTNEPPDAFKRRLKNNRRRLMSRLTQCGTKITGNKARKIRRSGGFKTRQVRGCGEAVWQYTDVKVTVETEGRYVDVGLVGVVGIKGRYYVLDQIYCD